MSPGGDGSIKQPDADYVRADQDRLSDAWDDVRGRARDIKSPCVNLECVRLTGSRLPAVVLRHPKLRLVLRVSDNGPQCVEAVTEAMEQDCMGDPKWVEQSRFNSTHPITQMLCAELNIDNVGKPRW